MSLAQQVLKKIVRFASAFPSPPFRSSDFAGLRRPRLYGFHTGTRSLSNRKGRGRRRGGRAGEPRIGKARGCSQGAQRAVFCAVRVADFLAEGAEWGASPGRGGRVGVPPAALFFKKFVSLASFFPSRPLGLPTSQARGGLGCMDSTLTRSLSNRKGRGRRRGG